MHFVSYYTKAEFVAAGRAVVTGIVDSSLFVTEHVGLGMSAGCSASYAVRTTSGRC